ncbi:SusE domain-containing protein [Robertkochia aurantiaca]|uniref:SusE domain-containing protein n=1 Tax=Robertkochia aurantiaca TaxID=2873700 RepID=UPI001CCA8E20|nr:SusF/SusE family outer membrane protein [Robertkochia sp. 3YJGBD-33]
MKKFLKSLQIFAMAAAVGAGFTSCDNEDYLVITAQEPSDAVMFTNTLSEEYLLSSETASNVAERFVWNEPNFEAPTPVNYILEGSVTPEFASVDYSSGTIEATNQAVMVRDLLSMAEIKGLDNDPATTDENGEANNSGDVYFRVKAFVGDAGAVNAVETMSETMALTISLIEQSEDGGNGFEVSAWGIVGSATANGWDGPDQPFYTTDQADIYVAYVDLADGEIKFRENNDWTLNYGDSGADGTLDEGGDNIMVTAGTYKITMDLGALTYTMEEYQWGVVGEASANGWDGPDQPFYYDYTTNTFKAGVKLADGEIKFRLNNDWAVNYGDTGADGTLDNGGDNIVVSAGYYLITLDIANQTYTIEEAELFGVVGSAYNDWGGAGPDALLTEVQPGVWIGKDITLLDGEMKFRINEDWGTNYGDTGADGILDQDGDNIVVTAGTYTITLDFSDSGAPTYTIQ